MTRGVLALDLDGTLVDCRRRQVALARRVMPRIDPERFWADKRMGATTRAALEAQGVAAADAQVAADAWVARIEDPRWLRVDALLPGAAEAVAAVRAAGLEPMVLTARRDADAVRAQVAATGLPVGRVVVVDPRHAAAEKAAALRETGAAGLVGDSESDAAAARAADVAFAAVAGGQRAERFLRERGIAPVYPDVLAAVRALLAGRQTT